MRRAFHGTAFLIALGLVVPASAADDNKKKDDDKAATKADDKKKDDKKPAKDDKKKDKAKKAAPKDEPTDAKDKLRPAGEFIGKLTRVEGQQKYLSVQITLTVPEPYLNGRTIAYRAKNIEKQIEVLASDNMKVRIGHPPLDYDEKGRLKRYTRKELKELKGAEGGWGYTADFDSLKPNQVVKVFLGKKKEARKARSRDKDLDEDLHADNKPTAIMVYIIADPNEK
ncbi:MAG TPA: hypothetical protein VG013_16840 [Gemmataceae bacterium]|jgi:hypothetical protein|nr:hypothetical protein [Gemmataceae bacterium]